MLPVCGIFFLRVTYELTVGVFLTVGLKRLHGLHSRYVP